MTLKMDSQQEAQELSEVLIPTSHSIQVKRSAHFASVILDTAHRELGVYFLSLNCPSFL